MAAPLGPLEVTCDAPPYAIVCACRMIGLQRPEDVVWRRLTHFVHGRGIETTAGSRFLWSDFLMQLAAARVSCSCRAALPIFNRYDFTFSDGTVSSFLIGQCGRCHAVYWEKLSC